MLGSGGKSELGWHAMDRWISIGIVSVIFEEKYLKKNI
jgi:hypothetical protein